MQVHHEEIPSTGKAFRDAWLKSKNLTRLIEKAKATGEGGIITTCAAPGSGFIKLVVPELPFSTKVFDITKLSPSPDMLNTIEHLDVVILDTRQQSDTQVLDQLLYTMKNQNTAPQNIVFILVVTSHNDYIARKLHE